MLGSGATSCGDRAQTPAPTLRLLTVWALHAPLRAARFLAFFGSVRCVDPRTGRPYTVTTIENALRDAHFAVAPTRSGKQQALEAIRKLIDHGMPIARAKVPRAAALVVGRGRRGAAGRRRPLGARAFAVQTRA